MNNLLVGRSLKVHRTSILFCMVAALALLSCIADAKAATPIATKPSETDARITEHNEPHMSWLPTGKPKGQLLLFLPGTHGQPKEQFPLADTASELGYHVIALMYPDTIAAQQVCRNSSDPDAYIKFRMGIIQGGEIGPRQKISEVDSIENRLTKLLVYLQSNYPKQGWDQYLQTKSGIAWQKFAVAGHSQGGGHAYMIAKQREVARVIMFGSPKDFSFHFQRPAKGFDSETRTPLVRFFTFNHTLDNGNGCTHDQQTEILKQMKLLALGVAHADKPRDNFGHAHVIYLDVELPNSEKYHGSVLNDKLSRCRPVWKYMLSEPVD